MFSGGLGVTDAAIESVQVKSERLEITLSARYYLLSFVWDL